MASVINDDGYNIKEDYIIKTVHVLYSELSSYLISFNMIMQKRTISVYWGGADVSQTGKDCQCGTFDMCVSGSSGRCHCDADHDDVWQRDAGYLTAKWKLPVSSVL